MLREMNILLGEANLSKLFNRPFRKGSYSKRKVFATVVCEFFPFREDLYVHEGKTGLKDVVSLNDPRKICQGDQIPLTLNALWAESADYMYKLVIFFLLFPKKQKSDTSCKLSPRK